MIMTLLNCLGVTVLQRRSKTIAHQHLCDTFLTSTCDDRVHPGHARKMVARMQAQGHHVSSYENLVGGHGGAADHPQTAYMWALAYTYLWNELARK